jgi:glycosyltransferase involved in cell wall biosynthesis
MKVCFVSHDSQMGGAERALLELISGLRQKGVDCFVLLPNPGPMIQCLEQDGVPFAVIPYQSWVHEGEWWLTLRKGFRNIRMIAPVARQLEQWDIDIVWTNSAAAPPVGALAAKARGLPHIWFLHEFVRKEFGITYPLGIRLSCKVIAWVSSCVLVCSKVLADYYAQYIRQHQLQVVYQAAQFSCSLFKQEKHLIPTSSQAPKLLLVGTIHEGKRQIDAIRAIGQLATQGIQAALFIVGWDIPLYLEQIKEVASDIGVEGAVHFCGFVDDASALMKEADIVLSCSMWEAFPRVTVEAMRAGRPIVGARHAGTAELIRDGFNGLLFTPGDHRELASKIRLLIENPKLAEQLGTNGRQWAERQFSVEKYAERVLQILADVAGSCHPDAAELRSN